MDIIELIYTLLTLIFLIFIFTGPLMKKLLKNAENKAVEEEGQPQEDRVHEGLPLIVKDTQRKVPQTKKTGDQEKEGNNPAKNRLEKLPSLKRAIVWSEILGKPLALKDQK